MQKKRKNEVRTLARFISCSNKVLGSEESKDNFLWRMGGVGGGGVVMVLSEEAGGGVVEEGGGFIVEYCDCEYVVNENENGCQIYIYRKREIRERDGSEKGKRIEGGK